MWNTFYVYPVSIFVVISLSYLNLSYITYITFLHYLPNLEILTDGIGAIFHFSFVVIETVRTKAGKGAGRGILYGPGLASSQVLAMQLRIS